MARRRRDALAKNPRCRDRDLQGDPAEQVYVIERGLVKLLHVRGDGRAAIVGLRSKGWILGGAAALLGERHEVSVWAVTPCQLRRMSAKEFRRVVRTGAGFSWALHLMHSQEVLNEIEHVAALNSLSARERLKEFLSRLRSQLAADLASPCEHLPLPLREWEIAQLVAITPQWMCQLMHELEAEGILRRDGNHWKWPAIVGLVSSS